MKIFGRNYGINSSEVNNSAIRSTLKRKYPDRK